MQEIFWAINKESGHCHYYTSKPVFSDSVKKMIQAQGTKIIVYNLKTEITPEILENLLNGTFNHCMFSNYLDAKVIEQF